MTAGGLTNQLMGHLSALLIAQEVGAGVVLPPVFARDAFAGDAAWEVAPTESLLDVDSMATYWAHRNLRIHKVRPVGAQGAGTPPTHPRRTPPPPTTNARRRRTSPPPPPHKWWTCGDPPTSCIPRRTGALTSPSRGRGPSCTSLGRQPAAMPARRRSPTCVNLDTASTFFRVRLDRWAGAAGGGMLGTYHGAPREFAPPGMLCPGAPPAPVLGSGHCCSGGSGTCAALCAATALRPPPPWTWGCIGTRR